MKQYQFVAPSLPLVFASLLRKVVQLLVVKRPAVQRPKVIELDIDGTLYGLHQQLLTSGFSCRIISGSRTETDPHGLTLYILLP